MSDSTEIESGCPGTDHGYSVERITRNEVALLGGLLLLPKMIPEVAESVRPQFFRDLAYGETYRVLVEMHRELGDFDIDLVRDRLEDRLRPHTGQPVTELLFGLLMDCDGRERYTSEVLVREHARFVSEVGLKRKFTVASDEIRHAANNGHTTDELATLWRASAAVFEEEIASDGSTCWADVTAEPVEWFWRPWIPRGHLTEIIAPGGVGKSTFMATLLANVTTGTAQYGHDEATSPANVVVLCEDSIADTYLPRFLAAGGDPRRVFTPPITTLDMGGLGVLTTEIRTREASLVVIDPPEAFLPDDVDPHVAASLRTGFLGPLTRMAQETRTTLPLVRNVNKNEAASGSHRGSGSHAWRDAVRSSIHVGFDPVDASGRIIVHDKSNLGQFATPLAFTIQGTAIQNDDGWSIPTSRIVWTGERPDMALKDVFRTGRSADVKVDELVEFLSQHPGATRADIRKAELPGLTSGSASNKAIQAGKKQNRIREVAGGQLYKSSGNFKS